jgi:hypothetical protein
MREMSLFSMEPPFTILVKRQFVILNEVKDLARSSARHIDECALLRRRGE